jgi:hypothetical protein
LWAKVRFASLVRFILYSPVLVLFVVAVFFSVTRKVLIWVEFILECHNFVVDGQRLAIWDRYHVTETASFPTGGLRFSAPPARPGGIGP